MNRIASGLASRALAFLRSRAAIYLFGSVVSRIAGIVLIPLYTRRFSFEDYGEYSLVTSILQLLPTCGSLGLSAGLSRVYFDTKDKAEGERAMGAVARGMIFVVFSTMLVLALAVRLFGQGGLFGITQKHLLLAIVAGVGVGIYTIPDVYFRVTQRPYHAVALELSAFLVNAGFGIAFVLGFSRGLTGAIEAVALAWSSVGAFGFFFVFLKLPAGNVGVELRRALRFSIAFVPHYVASWLQLTADRWVLTAYGATAALGIYYLAIQILSPIPMVTAALNDAEAPRYGELYRDGGAKKAYEALGSFNRRYLAVTAAPALALLLASPLLPIAIGPRFAPALAVLPVLGAAYLADALYCPAANYILYVGRTALIPIVTTTSAVAGVAGSILLLPRFGLPGLLVSRVGASVLRSGAMMLAARIARPRDEASGDR